MTTLLDEGAEPRKLGQGWCSHAIEALLIWPTAQAAVSHDLPHAITASQALASFGRVSSLPRCDNASATI